MIYNKIRFKFLFRLFLLSALILCAVLFVFWSYWGLAGLVIFISIGVIYNTNQFLSRRFRAIDEFFESVKYKDFSKWFTDDSGPEDLRMLFKGFNQVNESFNSVNIKNETQYLYLQKILEMVNVGIMAFDVESGLVLWSNESFRSILDLPIFKNINFVKKRKKRLYDDIFESYYPIAQSIGIVVNQENIKVLISNTLFHSGENSYKLVVLQNIDHTLNKNESEAWKKLLSVMTHEIMNSIAPISSLAGTLEEHLQLTSARSLDNTFELNDLKDGLKTIKKRSDGLLKFARVYRTLNKVSHLNKSEVSVIEVFNNVYSLMEPSLEANKTKLNFEVDSQLNKIEIDPSLIEQVLINLIKNAMEACEGKPNASISLNAKKDLKGSCVIKVKDNGMGIPQEIIDNVFIPFFTSKNNGSGIGLSLCKQIMVLHRGKIQIASKDKEGTVVSLIFPG